MTRLIDHQCLQRPRAALTARGALCCAASALAFAFLAAPALAEDAPTMAGESAHIKPAGERVIGAKERPTIKKKAAEEAGAKRGYRVSLQIPEALRATLAKKIDQRISRNLVQEKKLRGEAMALLSKFID